MKRPIYRLHTGFLGILRPTYSKEEYQKTCRDECNMVVWLFMVPLFLCMVAGALVLIFV